jgi:hypothetical protein
MTIVQLEEIGFVSCYLSQPAATLQTESFAVISAGLSLMSCGYVKRCTKLAIE